EISFMLSRNRLVVPVVHRSCEIPYRLARLQNVDFTGPREQALHSLIERLQAAMAHAGPAGSPPLHPPAHAEIRTHVPALTPTQAASTASATVPAWRRLPVAGAAIGV